jgi:hypothetical protein
MTRRNRKQPADAKRDQAPPPGPIDVVDGIPDRQAGRSVWKLLVLAGIFVAWIAFLLYCGLAGAPPK